MAPTLRSHSGSGHEQGRAAAAAGASQFANGSSSKSRAMTTPTTILLWETARAARLVGKLQGQNSESPRCAPGT